MEARYARSRSISIKDGDISESGVVRVLAEVLRGKVAEACVVGRFEVIDPFPNREWGGYADQIGKVYEQYRDDGYQVRFERIDGYASVSIVSW